METKEIHDLTLPSETFFEDEYAHVLAVRENKAIICILKKEYVPINNFQDIFLKISELVIEGGFRKFIFDKRALKAFHQPSMEWYYIHWKQNMYTHGLEVHRKILPPEPWFRKTVALARNEIIDKYADTILTKLDIQYCESIEEAINLD